MAKSNRSSWSPGEHESIEKIRSKTSTLKSLTFQPKTTVAAAAAQDVLRSTRNTMNRTSADDNSIQSKSNGQVIVSNMKTSQTIANFQSYENPAVVMRNQHHIKDESVEGQNSRSTKSSSSTDNISQRQQQQQDSSCSSVFSINHDDYRNKIRSQQPFVEKKLWSDDVLVSNANQQRKERFQKIFTDIAASDELLQYYYCTYSREILFPGFMYVTQNWICFHSKIMGKKTIRIPVQSIDDISKTRTAKLIPNAIGISIRHDKYVFGSLVSREKTFSFLTKVWRQKLSQEEEKTFINGSDGVSYTSSEENMSTGSDKSIENQAVLTSQPELRSSSNEVLTGQCRDKVDTIQGRQDHSMHDSLISQDVTQRGKRKGSTNNSLKNTDLKRFSWFRLIPTQLKRFSTRSAMLALTVILIAFLLLSAVLLAYKLIDLQAQMEVYLLPHDSDNVLSKSDQSEKLNEYIYNLENEQHISNIQRLHSLLEVQIKLLDKVNKSLKGLRQTTLKSCPEEEEVNEKYFENSKRG